MSITTTIKCPACKKEFEIKTENQIPIAGVCTHCNRLIQWNLSDMNMTSFKPPIEETLNVTIQNQRTDN